MDQVKINYKSGKTYTHAQGFSCAFRQWRASSHCRLIHGYALKFEFEFGCSELDERNWAVDFGALKPLKAWLEHMFDHTLCIADDDPHKDTLMALQEDDLADVRIVEAVGCERFAELTFRKAQEIIGELYGDRCWVQSVTVREHEGNHATVERVNA